jgi:hypothetical protein
MSETDGLEIDILAGSLRADAGDMKTFVEILAKKLEDTFPSRVKIQRKGLPGRPRPVVHLSLNLGESQFELDNDKGQVATRRRKMVRGVALNTEELSLDGWIDQLSACLVDEAGRSQSDRMALERLLGG